MCTTDTQADEWVQVSWLRSRPRLGVLSGRHYQVRVDGHVLLAFPVTRIIGAPRQRGRTYCGPVHQVKNSSLIPIRELRPWGPGYDRGLRHHNLDQSRNVRGTALWVQFLKPRHTMSQFSSFVLKTSSHQEYWFDGRTWPNRPELHKIKCAARWRSPNKWPTGKQITRTVLRCRTDYRVASIHAVHRRYATLDPRSKTCFRCTAAVIPTVWPNHE